MKRLRWRPWFKRAWTMRYVVAASALYAVEVILPMFSDAIPRGLFAVLSLVSGIGAAVARFTADEVANGNDK